MEKFVDGLALDSSVSTIFETKLFVFIRLLELYEYFYSMLKHNCYELDSKHDYKLMRVHKIKDYQAFLLTKRHKPFELLVLSTTY
jgi:hypothetical protein